MGCGCNKSKANKIIDNLKKESSEPIEHKESIEQKVIQPKKEVIKTVSPPKPKPLTKVKWKIGGGK
ncbi:MAG: hypothetical protein M0R03_20950 [Novosphingobium sp.]|nr:hypothetical protein [Novosphingobium sp.]